MGNNHRVRAREWLIPLLRERLALQKAADLAELFERHGLPFAPITRPHELLNDPHLCATGGLAPITLPDGQRAGETAQTVLLPLALDGQRLGVRRSPPRLGEHSDELLTALGYSSEEAAQLSRTVLKAD
jgi:crotonobetainyl-CoA:carnitine CoA-transferase CaiB-like acyl-CoA transferase